MDPEELNAMAAAQGLPVIPGEHSSVVDHPMHGPMEVAHAPRARVPRSQVVGPIEGPTVVALPETYAAVRRADDARAQVAAWHASHPVTGQVERAVPPIAGPSHAPADVPASWLALPEPAIPADVPASWLSGADPAAGLREGARSLLAADQAMTARAPVSSLGMPQFEAPAAVTPPVTQAAAPSAPRPLRAGGVTGLERPATDAPTLPGLLMQYGDDPSSFQQTIGSLAQGHAGRRAPDLIDRQEQVALQQAGARQKSAGQQQQLMQRQVAEQQQLERARQDAMANAQRAYQSSVERVASARLDPQQWFRDQGAAGTIGAILAVALGAVGGALRGDGQNSALDQINTQIERDLQAQQSAIDSGRAAADLRGNLLSITRQEYGDRQSAMSAAHAQMLDQVGLQLDGMMADIGSDEARNAADALREQLAAAAAEARQAAADADVANAERMAHTQQMLARAHADELTTARRAAGGGGAGRPFIAIPSMYSSFNSGIASGFSPTQAAQLAGFPPGIIPSHSTETAEQRSTVDALSSSLNVLESAASAEDIPGVGLYDSRLPGPEGRLVRDEIGNAIDLIGRLRSGGAISEEEGDRFTAILGADESQTEDQFRAGLTRVRRELAARLGHTAQQDSAPARDDAEVGFVAEAP